MTINSINSINSINTINTNIRITGPDCAVMCVCVCVFFPLILDIKFVGHTSRGHTGFLIHLSAARALTFLARRIQPFLSLVDCEVEFCVLTISSFSTRWAFSF